MTELRRRCSIQVQAIARQATRGGREGKGKGKDTGEGSERWSAKMKVVSSISSMAAFDLLDRPLEWNGECRLSDDCDMEGQIQGRFMEGG